MPRVVVVLEAQTQAAVNNIQAFAKAQRDAFDAIRAGNPALADATVKVSALKEAYTGAAQAARDFAVQGPPAAASIKTVTTALTDAKGAVVAYGTGTAAAKAASSQFYDALAAGAGKSSAALGAFDNAAKSLLAGSLRDLTGGIPVLDSALTKLIGSLGGFPLVVGGIVGAGGLLIKTLADISAEASKTNAAIETLSKSIEADLQRTMGNIAKLRAEGAGAPGTALSIGAANEIKALETARDAAIAAAQKELDKTPDPRGALIPISLPERMLAEATFQTARAKAAEEAALKIFEIETRLKNDLGKLDEDYTKKLDEGRAKNLEGAEQAAEKQAKLLEDLAHKSLAIFQRLGEPFKDVTESLTLAQFVKDSTAAIDTLQQAIGAGLDTTGRFAAGIKALQERMAEAIKLGHVPLQEATKATTAAFEDSARAANFTAAAYAAMGAAAMQAAQAMAALDAAKSRAASTSPLQPGMSQGAAEAAGARSLSDLAAIQSHAATIAAAQGVLNTYASANRPWTSTPVDAPSAYGTFQHGGIVPGSGPVPIIAHGGEQILPAGGRSGGGGMVRIEPGAIQISGTVIDQTRDWDVLVELLGQSLAARGR